MTASLEEYLKTIYILLNQEESARVTDIANELGISKPSVNRALKVLKEDGYISYEAYGSIELTEKGIEVAKKIVRSQLAIESFLADILKVDEKRAKEEANIMRHAVSEDTIEKFENYVKEFIDIEQKECALYNPNSSKCKICKTGKSIKYRLNVEKEVLKNGTKK